MLGVLWNMSQEKQGKVQNPLMDGLMDTKFDP